MSWVGLDANTPIENGMVSKTIENSQVKVEGFHFDIRKHLVEFDDVVNKHRESYLWRKTQSPQRG